MARVMVAEDDPKQAELVRMYLTHQGHEVVLVTHGRAVLEQVRLRVPDLLVLDLMMPEVDGWEVCRRLRADYTLPILMVTARSTVEDRLLGLDLGADDYLTKPYDPRELMARIRALLRRVAVPEQPPAPATLGLGELRLDPDRHEVTLKGAPVPLTSGEFLILQTLLASPGRVFTRGQLLDRTRGSSQNVTERTIDVHVSNLRRKIERDPRSPLYLLTVFGVGYKLGPGS